MAEIGLNYDYVPIYNSERFPKENHIKLNGIFIGQNLFHRNEREY